MEDREARRYRRSVNTLRQATPATSRKNPASVLVTMACVTGMFAVVGLPAYANVEQPASTAPLASSVGAQSLKVDSDAAAISTARDAFTATTTEELAQQRAAALAAAYVYHDPGPRQAGDDYPFRGQGGLSPLRYYAGECVDFVAWRLNRDQGYTGPFRWDWGTMTPGGGSASQWTQAWYDHGWPVSGTPIAGAVAVTGYNHVAYVKEVYGDGSVLLEEYNYSNYHEYGTRVISAGSATYLYPPY